MENVTCFQIPPLHCSFPLRCHPHYSLIKEEMDAWTISLVKPSSEAAAQFLIQSQIPLLCCLGYPTCSDNNRLLSIFKMVAWFFLEDDISDDIGDVGTDPAAAKARYARVRNILEGTATPGDFEGKAGTALQELSDLWKELREDMPARQHARFVRSFQDFLDVETAQIQNRKAGHVPDLKTYTEMRIHSSLSLAFFILAEYSLGMELDEEALQSSVMGQLLRAAANHMAWTNDLLSFRREASQGDTQNLVFVLCAHNALDIQQSVLRVSDMIREVDQECLALIGAVKKSDLIDKPGMRSFLDGLGFSMAANFHWSYKSARYHGVGATMNSEDHTLEVNLQSLSY